MKFLDLIEDMLEEIGYHKVEYLIDYTYAPYTHYKPGIYTHTNYMIDASALNSKGDIQISVIDLASFGIPQSKIEIIIGKFKNRVDYRTKYDYANPKNETFERIREIFTAPY